MRYFPKQAITTARPKALNGTAQNGRRKTPPKCRVLSTVIEKSGSSKENATGR